MAYKDLSPEKQRVIHAILADMVSDLEEINSSISWSEQDKLETGD